MFIYYTFIIPHKNIPSLLRRCLNSIPCRPDIEIIVVDDNSDEESIKELKKLSRKELQIIYTTADKGAGYARNVGLKIAKGEWIVFADSDDVFEPDFNKILDILLNDSISDVVNFDVTSRNSETNKPNDEIEKINYHCTDEKYLNDPMSFKYVTLVPWGKVIRRDFITQYKLQFEEIKHGNDLRFASLCDFFCRHRRIIPIIGYCWMFRNNSLWRQRNLEWAETRFYVLVRTGKLMRNNKETEFGNRLIDGSRGFCTDIKAYSYPRYIKSLIVYGMARKSFWNIFIEIPYILFRDFFSFFAKKLNKYSY